MKPSRMRLPRVAFAAVLGSLWLVLAGCSQSSPTGASPALASAGVNPSVGGQGDLAPAIANPTFAQKLSPFRFTDIVHEAGIDFVHFSGMTVDKHFPTANGSGVAIFDYDGDGKMDLYFATGTLLPVGKETKGPNRLYKNLGDGKFLDVTESSGLGFAGYCHGIVVGDIDNDGDQDVFLCNYGPNVLYLNNGDGTFVDISHQAGVDRPNWSSSGALLDYDNDGDLDLYVANYGEWKYPEDDKFCTYPSVVLPGEEKIRTYCPPQSIRTTKHILYRNNGDLTFTDVTDAAGVGRTHGHGFGVVTADLNGDGKTDIYVANDTDPNFLFLNNGDGTFQDVTDTAGAALDWHGHAMSGMGVDAEDVNGDGLPDLFVTNFTNQYDTLYRNLGKGLFTDGTGTSGMAIDSFPWIKWGCALADFDNDGWPDCFVTTGHVDDNEHLFGRVDNYAQPALLHRNLEGERFLLSTRGAGPYFDTKHVGRGVAFGDIDDDGDIDIVVNHKDSAPAVLRNDTPTKNHWIRLRLVGTRSNRDAIGTRIEVKAGHSTIFRQRKGGASMESANDPRVLVGIGTPDEATKVVIRWPSGAVSTLEHLAADRTYEVIEPKTNP